MATVIAAIAPAAPMIHRVCACIARWISALSVAVVSAEQFQPHPLKVAARRPLRVGGDRCHAGDGITTPPAVTACITSLRHFPAPRFRG